MFGTGIGRGWRIIDAMVAGVWRNKSNILVIGVTINVGCGVLFSTWAEFFLLAGIVLLVSLTF